MIELLRTIVSGAGAVGLTGVLSPVVIAQAAIRYRHPHRFRADDIRRRLTLGFTHGDDLFGGTFRAPTTVRHYTHEYFVAARGVTRQSAAAKHLQIVGVCADGEYVHKVHPLDRLC